VGQAGVRLVLYSKAQCGLCEDAYDVIEEVRRALRPRLETVLEVVDITTDTEIFRRYRYDIPVLVVDGREAFRHRVDPERLTARLIDGVPAPLEELRLEQDKARA